GQPRPVVLDARGRTPADAAVVREGAVVVTAAGAPDGWRRELDGAGVEVVTVPGAGDGEGVDASATLDALFARDVRSVLCEGGPTVAGALLRAGLVDRLVLHVAPAVLAADGLAAVGGPAPSPAIRWRLDTTTRYGPDLELELRPIRDGG
ncbi:MAG: RibD family protein, partial [Actinobacteria bacterium]|nr:RibD family protein [Actinomycetota bacterium]